MPARTALDGTPCWIDLTSSDTEVAKSFYTNVFGKRRRLPAATAPGDVVLVADAGAYGYTMAR